MTALSVDLFFLALLPDTADELAVVLFYSYSHNSDSNRGTVLVRVSGAVSCLLQLAGLRRQTMPFWQIHAELEGHLGHTESGAGTQVPL